LKFCILSIVFERKYTIFEGRHQLDSPNNPELSFSPLSSFFSISLLMSLSNFSFNYTLKPVIIALFEAKNWTYGFP